MSKKRKPPSSAPSKAYLLSFGDTMTALLAFFIVLNSLAKEQTGANLHSGTGSFIRAVEGTGLPGTYPGKTSKHIRQQDHMNPLYIVEPMEDVEPDKNAGGPDEDSNDIRVVDREKDNFDRFILEMERLYTVRPLAPTEGEVVFDIFHKLNPEPPLLPAAVRNTAMQVLPQLRDERYQVELVVWATTPGESAWNRAIEQSRQLRNELLNGVRMTPSQESRLHAVGQPWLFSDSKRPVMSFVVRKAISPAN